jgi:hypothetical protein
MVPPSGTVPAVPLASPCPLQPVPGNTSQIGATALHGAVPHTPRATASAVLLQLDTKNKYAE